MENSFQTLRIKASAPSASCVCDHVVFVGGRKTFAGSHECTTCTRILEPYFSRVSKI